jgi:uncharacterized Zn-binding protein involved in type VI secretion
MVMRAVICKDDPTSHGGVVMEGNPHATADGRPIAQKGHMTHCPQCRGDFPIAEGLDRHTFAGKGTAVEGMKTACGATLVATTTKGFMMVDDESENKKIAGAAAVSATSPKSSTQPAGPNAGSFRAVDRDTSKPVQGMRYRIELADGATLRGVTDADGYTERVSGHDPATVTLHWEGDEPFDDA